MHIYTTTNDAYAGIEFSSSLSGAKNLTINQGTAGKLNFTSPGVIDLVTMDFNNNGVGIRQTNPTHALQLGVDDAYKPGTSTWGVLSDRRVKENISSFTDGLNVLLQMKPIWFDYNGIGGTVKGLKSIGAIAQELQAIAPYMVSEVNAPDEKGITTKYLSVNYHSLFFVLVNAMKEQQQMIEKQSEQMQDQGKQIADQNRLIEQLIKRVETFEVKK